MNWNAQEIRTLRLRLGWSAADFGRRMSCSVEMILSWEAGQSVPDPEMHNQFRFLNSYVERNALHLSQKPRAEELMQNERLAQITHDHVSDKTNLDI